jgi:hypothetical protein
MPTTLEPVEVMEPDVDSANALSRPWIVLVWNDPVNLMSYVTYVFQKLFGFSLEKATELYMSEAEPWWLRGHAKRPRCTCSGSTSTACGPRWNTKADEELTTDDGETTLDPTRERAPGGGGRGRMAAQHRHRRA